MAIKTINKALAKDEGFCEPVDCPQCGKNVAMRLFELVDKSAVAVISKDDKDLAVAVCPSCASVFSVNKNYLKEKQSGTFVFMTKEDLKLMVKGK
ncbi:MAG: hypothetical protein IJ491_02070 [Clostridia bacterium]|nr:hypothetical protein [Clostridia bacterium]